MPVPPPVTMATFPFSVRFMGSSAGRDATEPTPAAFARSTGNRRLFTRRVAMEYDPEKWELVFGKDHVQAKS
jgi:hypothetical protein